MPTYSYRCTECGTAFDIQQAFTDDTLTECPNCKGALRKVFNSVGVTFNGSGFYRTDSRAKPGDGGSGSGGSGSGGSGSGGDSGSASGSDGSSSKKETAAAPAASGASSSGASSSGASSSGASSSGARGTSS